MLHFCFVSSLSLLSASYTGFMIPHNSSPLIYTVSSLKCRRRSWVCNYDKCVKEIGFLFLHIHAYNLRYSWEVPEMLFTIIWYVTDHVCHVRSLTLGTLSRYSLPCFLFWRPSGANWKPFFFSNFNLICFTLIILLLAFGYFQSICDALFNALPSHFSLKILPTAVLKLL